MSLSEMNRLESTLLMLLRSADTSQPVHDSSVDEAFGSCWRSQSDIDTNTRRHLPLAVATSLPLTSTQSSFSHPMLHTSSIDCITAAAAAAVLPLGAGLTDDRGGASMRYKTELCRAFAENGWCRYGDKCQFAHGHYDLRAVARHPKYKTDLCRTYHTTGLCPYGARCHFIHNEDEVPRRLPVVERPQRATQKQHEVDLAVRELELRLVLLRNVSQRPGLAQPACQSPPSTTSPFPYFSVDHHSQQQQSDCGIAAAMSAAPRTALQNHTQLHDHRPAVSSLQSARRPTSLIGALPLIAGSTFDSVGNTPSPPSSFVDDGEFSPAPLSPAGARQQQQQQLEPLTSNDNLTALLVLAAKLRLLAAH